MRDIAPQVLPPIPLRHASHVKPQYQYSTFLSPKISGERTSIIGRFEDTAECQLGRTLGGREKRLETGLSTTTLAALIAYVLAAVCAALLFRRGQSWRFKFICIVAGVLPLHQAVKLVIEAGGWQALGPPELSEFAELAVAAMFLSCVFVLKKELYVRGGTEQRLRLAEGAAGWSTQGQREPKGDRARFPSGRSSTRRCMQCNRTIRGLRAWFSRSPFCSDAHRDAFYEEHALPRLCGSETLDELAPSCELSPEPRVPTAVSGRA